MDIGLQEFAELKNISPNDFVEVKAKDLQDLVKQLLDMQDIKEVVKAVRDDNDKLVEENNALTNKLERCYDENEVLYRDNMNKASMIKTLKKQMAEIGDISTNNARLKREHKEMKDKLIMSNALLQYRRNEERYRAPSTMRVDLGRA